MIDLIKKLGLEETQEKALIGAFNEEKSKFDKSLNDLQAEFLNKEKTLKEELSKFNDYDDLKTKLADFEQENANTKLQLEEMKNRGINDKMNFEIEKRLLKENAKHVDLLMSAFDKSAVKFENDTFTGIEEGLNKLKESYSDLFNQQAIKGLEPQQKTKSPQSFNPDNMSAQELANNWDKYMESQRRFK